MYFDDPTHSGGSSKCAVMCYCLLMNYSPHIPVMLQSKRKVGTSPLYTPLWPSLLELLGIGMVIVIGLWNFLLRGSNVTIELNVALLPRIFRTTSTSMG